MLIALICPITTAAMSENLESTNFNLMEMKARRKPLLIVAWLTNADEVSFDQDSYFNEYQFYIDYGMKLGALTLKRSNSFKPKR